MSIAQRGNAFFWEDDDDKRETGGEPMIVKEALARWDAGAEAARQQLVVAHNMVERLSNEVKALRAQAHRPLTNGHTPVIPAEAFPPNELIAWARAVDISYRNMEESERVAIVTFDVMGQPMSLTVGHLRDWVRRMDEVTG